mmetsp:Transcript_135658/g.220755  ORF Transcript_135658/g.220755 Transcript_135658/m.220755 type:complete len:547 (-) Transcript_135658:264-1904(-)
MLCLTVFALTGAFLATAEEDGFNTTLHTKTERQLTLYPARWTLDEVEAAKDHIFKAFQHDGGFRPGTVLRLSFHDCIPYQDGTGGCDGCLNWQGVGVERFPESTLVQESADIPDIEEGDGANNALGDAAMLLEDIYTRNLSGEFTDSLQASGKSRADLWALAGIAAVEYTMKVNNAVCDSGRTVRQDRSKQRNNQADFVGQCLYSQGRDNCKAIPTRNLVFKTGRRDCNSQWQPSYKTFKKENHPHARMSGKDVTAYMRDNFGFTGRETVAIMGAHTIGVYHMEKTGFKYVWTTRNEMSFNNEYYRNMVLEPNWQYNFNTCTKNGDAWGEMPHARWAVKANMFTTSGGPVQWIKFDHVGAYCEDRPERGSMYWETYQQCCRNGVPNGAKSKPDNGRAKGTDSLAADDNEYGGCERWRFAFGRDHAMLNTDMGLYLDFDVDADGYPRNCSGLEDFEKNHVVTRTREGVPVREAWQSFRWAWQGCGKQEFRHPRGARPLYQYVDEFARDQRRWLDAFIPAMEKYLEKGYSHGELQEPRPRGRRMTWVV